MGIACELHPLQDVDCSLASIKILANFALAQDDKYSAKYMVPYCRDAVDNKPPTLTIDAVLQGMCVGVVDAIDFVMSEYPPEEQPTAAALRAT